MKSTTKAYWDQVSMQCNAHSKTKDAMYLDSSLRAEYIKNCDIAYDNCKQTAMSNEVVNLDRHKVASILVTEAMKLGIIKREDNKEMKDADTDSEFFIGPQKILLICAIHYLAQEINRILGIHGNAVPQMTQFQLPKAFSCDTSYIDIISRLLRNELDDDKLYMLSLAEKFFLLEYIAIQAFYGDSTEKVYALLRKPITQ